MLKSLKKRLESLDTIKIPLLLRKSYQIELKLQNIVNSTLHKNTAKWYPVFSNLKSDWFYLETSVFPNK